MWAATVVYWVISLVQYTKMFAALQDAWLTPTNFQHRLMQVCLAALEHAEEKPLETQCDMSEVAKRRSAAKRREGRAD